MGFAELLGLAFADFTKYKLLLYRADGILDKSILLATTMPGAY